MVVAWCPTSSLPCRSNLAPQVQWKSRFRPREWPRGHRRHPRCSFSAEPGFSLAQLNLIWQLTDTKQLVHSFAEGRDGPRLCQPHSALPDLLAQGNASLRLARAVWLMRAASPCFVTSGTSAAPRSACRWQVSRERGRPPLGTPLYFPYPLPQRSHLSSQPRALFPSTVSLPLPYLTSALYPLLPSSPLLKPSMTWSPTRT